jgi:hypothetical protein
MSFFPFINGFLFSKIERKKRTLSHSHGMPNAEHSVKKSNKGNTRRQRKWGSI